VPDPAVLLEAGAKALLYAALLIAIGASAMRWLLLPRAANELGPDRILAIELSVARLALGAASAALAACILRVWTHTVSAFGLADAASWDNLRLIALESRWGQSWRLQTAAALILVVACAATAWSRTAWPLATLAVFLFTATIPLLGHAAGDAFRMVLHTVHILAGGFWLGTLAVVLLMRMPAASPYSIGPRLTARQVRLIILRRFSALALPSAATAAVAGIVAAYLYVGAFSNLWATGYGRVLLVKVALVGGISIAGYVNWQRLRRLNVEDEPSATIIVLEAALAAAVVLVTSVLTEIAHPG
jgi:putative copper resistance protein D